MLLVLLAGCTAAPMAPVKENPMPVPTTPVTSPPASPSGTMPAGGPDCIDSCMSDCSQDGEAACLTAEDYNTCTSNCGSTVRPEGCKGACATGVPVECGIIFKKECQKDCNAKCAAS